MPMTKWVPVSPCSQSSEKLGNSFATTVNFQTCTGVHREICKLSWGFFEGKVLRKWCEGWMGNVWNNKGGEESQVKKFSPHSQAGIETVQYDQKIQSAGYSWCVRKEGKSSQRQGWHVGQCQTTQDHDTEIVEFILLVWESSEEFWAGQ